MHPHPPTGLRDDRGSTLVEVLVAAVVGVVVLGAVSLFLGASLQDSNRTASRVDALDRASTGLERLRAELRQALELSPKATADVQTGVVELRRWTRQAGGGTSQRWVRLDCTVTGSTAGTRACRRTDLTSGTQELLLDGLDPSAAPVFTLRAPVAPAVSGQVLLDVRTLVPGTTNGIELRSGITPRPCNDGPPTGSTTCPG